MPACVGNVRSEGDVPQLPWAIERRDEGLRIRRRWDIREPKLISHPLNYSWIVVVVIDDLLEGIAIEQRADVVFGRVGDKKVIVEYPCFDATGVYPNIQNVFRYIKASFR